MLSTLLAVVVLPACGGGEQEAVTVTQSETVHETETVTIEAAPEAPDANADEDATNGTTDAAGASEREVGGTGIDADVAYRVTSLEVVRGFPTEEFSDPHRAVRGAKLVRADVTVKNNTRKPITPFCGSGNAVLIDEEDRNFDIHEDVLNIAGNNVCEDIPPGFQGRVILAFEIPAEARPAALAVWNHEDPDDYSGDSFILFRK